MYKICSNCNFFPKYMYIQTIIEIRIDKTSVRKVKIKKKKLLEIKILIMTIISAKHVGQNTSEI